MANRRKTKISVVGSGTVKKPSLLQQYRREEFVVEIGVDPDNPNQQVERLRRRCVYDEMLARGSIN